MKVVMLEMGGLMEDPDFHWEREFETSKNSLIEACDERAAKDPKFARFYKKSADGSCSFWSWRLKFCCDVFKDCPYHK